MESTYIIGSNMPGYLPDSEPCTIVGTFEDAREILLSDLEELAECATQEDDGDLAMDCDEAIENVRLWTGPDSIVVGKYVYWIYRQ